MKVLLVCTLIFAFAKSTTQDPLLKGFKNKLSQLEPLATQPLTSKPSSKVAEVVLSSLEESALQSISPGAEEFAIKLHSIIAENQENAIMSPLSLQLVLALVLAGANGVTYSELATLLSVVEIPEETTLLGYKSLLRVVQDPTLSLANRIFVDKSSPVKKSFQKIAEDYFFSSAQPLDFKKAPEESREYINSWVEEQTNEKIKDLLAAGSISGDTRLVLVNAIHFKANWKTKFDTSKTKDHPFYLSSTENKQIPMMNSKSNFQFLHDEDLGAKFLRLDYEGEKFEMIVILPDDINGLAGLESKLKNVNNFFERINSTKSTMVDVYFPKFIMENTIELIKVLKAMGVSSMFSDSADFGGITDGKETVSNVVQKVFIEVSEEGTEAAASTAVIVGRSLSLFPDETIEETFIADHPFLFFIVLKELKITCLCGRYIGFQ